MVRPVLSLILLLWAVPQSFAQDPFTFPDAYSPEVFRERVKTLSEIEVDRFQEQGLEAARGYISQELLDMGFRRVHHESFAVSGTHEKKGEFFRQGVNLYVEIPGTNRDGMIIVSAHYDTHDSHVPGADDNASGVAGVLAVAQDMMNRFQIKGERPERTVRFVFFDAEELGSPWYQGSAHHLDKLLMDHIQVRLMLNMDMIAYSPGGGSKVQIDPWKFIEAGDFLKTVNEKEGLGLKITKWGRHRSDQESAHDRGIPGVAIFENPLTKRNTPAKDYPYYHTPEDTLDKLNFEYAAKVANFVGKVALSAANTKKTWHLPNYAEVTKKARNEAYDREEHRFDHEKEVRSASDIIRQRSIRTKIAQERLTSFKSKELKRNLRRR